jgi:enamine deaminase RidA (YjgF/YER057c/UK114 family)
MEEQLKHYSNKLAYEIDSWDLKMALENGENVVVIDARSSQAYATGHIPGAINIPHRTMSSETTASLDPSALVVTYCDGIGCNASTKGALNMTQLGFRVKELMGGLEWWKRDGYSTEGIASAPLTRRRISSGSTFEEQIGYSRAVVDGDWVFVSGTTGFDYTTMSISDSLPEQTEQCLKNIESALRQADSSLKDVVRVTYVLPNGADFEQCWPVLRTYFGEVRPAAMMISAGLADPRIKIEIEVTARKRS